MDTKRTLSNDLTRVRSWFAALALIATVSGCKSGPQPATDNVRQVDRGEVQTAILASEPKVQHQSNCVFGEAIRFLGYDVSAEKVRPGDSFLITYYFKALRAVGRDYVMFVHMQGPNFKTAGADIISGDHRPVEGKYPTDAWLAGEVIKDVYKVQVPTAFTPGELTLWLGFFDPQSTERLPITNPDATQHDEGNRHLAGMIRVGK